MQCIYVYMYSWYRCYREVKDEEGGLRSGMCRYVLSSWNEGVVMDLFEDLYARVCQYGVPDEGKARRQTGKILQDGQFLRYFICFP